MPDAQKILTDAGIPIDIASGFSETIAKGAVIKTDPKAGSKIHKGSRLSVVVSAGPERFTIPNDLAGKDVTTVTSELKDLTLVVAGTRTVFDDKITLGLVVTSVPAPGAKVKRGTEITLIISKGPKPVPVPAIIGKSTTAATAALKAVGLELAESDSAYDNSAKGTVIKSSPAPGTSVPKGTVINVTVSKGPPLVAVPNVVGMTKSAAEQTLKDAGFKVATQSAFGGNRYVASQSPAAGTQLERGATVTIILVL
jgi:serine/threonine-protein kinase